MNTTIKTILHTYIFDTSKTSEREAYDSLKLQLKSLGLKCFSTIAFYSKQQEKFDRAIKSLDQKHVELKLSHVFDNQWNSAPIENISDNGLRLHDWSEHIYRSKNIKDGYWLEPTAEMQFARDNTMACGYCGKQEQAQKGNVFCPHCIDSEYLKSSELHLTRMQRVSDTSDRAKLSPAEKEYLLPLYKNAQLHGTTERGKAEKRDYVIKCMKGLDNV